MPSTKKSQGSSPKQIRGETPYVGTVKSPAAGEVVRVYWRKKHVAVEFVACCDCGLVHLMAYEPRKTYLRVRAWRDERRTREMRRIRRARRKHK